MKALWVSSDFWYQPGTGGGGYTHAVLDALSKSKTVSVTRELVVKWRPPTIARKLLSGLRSLVTDKSATRLLYASPDLPRLLAEPSAFSGVDAVILNGEDQLTAIDRVPPSIPVIYVMHNLERDYARLTLEALPRWQRTMLAASREVDKRVREEARLLDRASLILGISVDELETAARGRPASTCWLPPTFGPQVARRDRPAAGRLTIGLLGGLNHFPNRAAVDFMLQEVWPHADDRAHLLLAGKGTEAFTDEGRRIKGLGLVPDVNHFWRSIDVLAAPIFHGAGTNVKVCEALWHRVPMLVSPFALRGLPEFSDPAVRVLKDVARWRAALAWDQLARLAETRPAVELAEWFDQNVIVDRLDQSLAGVLHPSQAPAT